MCICLHIPQDLFPFVPSAEAAACPRESEPQMRIWELSRVPHSGKLPVSQARAASSLAFFESMSISLTSSAAAAACPREPEPQMRIWERYKSLARGILVRCTDRAGGSHDELCRQTLQVRRTFGNSRPLAKTRLTLTKFG
jgi:hypothetical protein